MAAETVQHPTRAQLDALVSELRDPNDTSLRFKAIAADWLELLVERADQAEARTALLESALTAAIEVADQARDEWDLAPQGMKAGKLLIALSGGLPGYRPDIDAIHRIHKPTTKEPADVG